jgi:ABC-type anion transport system duplicated permease subunit
VDRQHRDFSGLRRHAKVYSFRIITAVLAWVFIGVAFLLPARLDQMGVSELRRMASRPSAMLYPPSGAIASKSSFENSADSSGFRSQS